MHTKSSRICGLVAVVALAMSGRAGADDAPDPFRLIPENTDLVIRVDEPRRLLETVLKLAAFRQVQELQSVKEAYQSTNYRRFLQLVTHVEKELGMQWPELLDRLSGGGAVVAVKFGKQPPPVATVLQAKDEALLKRFVEMAVTITEGELARQESKDRLEKKSHRGIETIHIGKEFHAAVFGAAIVIANDSARLDELIDHHVDGKKNLTNVETIAMARKSLPPNSLAWVWVNLEVIRQAPEAKEVFANPRNDPNLTVAFGGWLDVARRAPFLCGAVFQEGERIISTVRMPAGRDGSPAELATHIPPTDAAGCLPLLEPKGVLFSTSAYLDIAKFWEYRDKLFNEAIAKAFVDADAKAAPFLAGNKLSQLLTQAGPHQRFVVTYQPNSTYPKGPFGFVGKLGYGVVVDMREPALGKSLETILRGAGLLARTFGQVKLKLFEDKYQDVNIIGYRQEDSDKQIYVMAQNNPLAYVPSASFAVVGDRFVAGSTLELTKELIDLLQKEVSAANVGMSSKASQTRIYGMGGADLLDGIQDILLAQTILDQALSPSDAREEVRKVIEWVRDIGVIEIESQYGANEFRYDVMLSPSKRNGHKADNK